MLALIGILVAMPASALVMTVGPDPITVTEGDTFSFALMTAGDGFAGVEGLDITFSVGGGFTLVSGSIPLGSPIPVDASVVAGTSLGVALTGAPFFFDIPASGATPVPFLTLTFSSLGVAPGTYTIGLSTLFNEDIEDYSSRVRVSVVAIPEPSTWLLASAGLWAVVVAGAKRRSTARRTPPQIRC